MSSGPSSRSPHIQEVWLRAEQDRHGVPDLTPREWEVLMLAARGLAHAREVHGQADELAPHS